MKITETGLRSLSTPESYARGHDLFRDGAIYDTFRQGNLLTGKCEGSSAPYYILRVNVDEEGIQNASCTCPYEWGGYCKHIIALMLKYIHDQDTFIEQKGIDELLADLDREALVLLIAKMIGKNPDLYLWLQTAVQVASVKAGPEQSRRKRNTQVSKIEYRRQIRSILHSLSGYRMSEAYWMMGGMVEQLREVCGTAYAFLDGGDAEGALEILSTLLTEVSGSYGEFDDSDGELGSFLDELALPMLEAILSADLSKSGRDNFIKELEPVIDDLSDYGIEEMDVILIALENEWSVGEDFDLLEADLDNPVVVEACLNVLERQNRMDQFLQLCLETGEYLRYILKQIELGKYDKATETAWQTLTQAAEVLQVARNLRDAGQLEEALRLAEKGLQLEDSKRELGAWLGPVEEALGRVEQAIQAYQAAFISLPSLELYQTLKKLSGPDWGALRPVLMQVFEGARYANELVDILLFEEEWDAAIGVADRLGEWHFDLIEKVADGVLSVRQDWVIDASRKQAEGLIQKTQSKYYAIAAHWLEKMKQAYISTNRKSDWQAYLDELKRTYSRRQALQAELRKL